MRSLIPLMRQQLVDAFRGDRSWLTGVWTGLLLVGLLTIPKWAFAESIGAPTPFLLYFAAILGATYRGGVVAGLITTLVASLVSWLFFMGPSASTLSREFPALVVFAVEGLCISLIMGGFVVERQKAAQAIKEAKNAQLQRDLVLSGVDEGIALQDPRGRLVYANQLAAENCGCSSPEELLKLSAQEMLNRITMFALNGEPLPLDQLPGRRILKGEHAPEITVRFRKAGETEYGWAVLRANAVRSEQGDVRFVVNVFRNVTEKFRRDAELNLARQWFQIALRSIGDAVIATDPQGRINLLNPVAEELTGWNLDDALGLPLEDVFNIIHEETREPVESPVRRVLREGATVALANYTLLVRRDGSEVAVDDSAAPIRGPNNELAGVILVFRNVSAKRAEEGRTTFLAHATEELNSSLDYRIALSTVARLAVPAIADWCAVDILHEGEVTRLAVAHIDNDKIERVQELERRYPSDRNASSGVYQILRTGQPEMIEEIPIKLLEASAQDEEHKRRILELGLRSYIGVPLKRGGETFGVITLAMAESKRNYNGRDFALAKDLAVRASLAVENARLFGDAENARQQAESANKIKDEFLAMLGHELRNPLAPIRSALEWMGRRPSEPHDREVGIIRRQVDHLVRLVDDLLDVARITNGRLEFNRHRVAISEVIDRATEMVWPASVQRAHTLHVDIQPGLAINCDFVRISQVIANLLTNAVKYTPEGGNIWIVAQSKGSSATIQVRDDGMGIGPDTLRKVFHLFVQEPQALDRAQGGLGLGLAIVQGLVSAHGGNVSAHSDGVGRGAEFIVQLPVGQVEIEERGQKAKPIQAAPSQRIMIVDDNHDACELLALLLVDEGHQVFVANDGLSALAIAEEEQPDVALLDIGLPEMSGYELGRKLRSLPGLKDINLIAVTGYGQAKDRERSRDAHFSAHLVKPIDLDSLNQVLSSSERPGSASNNDASFGVEPS